MQGSDQPRVLYRGVREVLTHNHNLLKDEDRDGMVALLADMLSDFVSDCDRRQAPKVFRIHWDGDFISDDYAMAWKLVIESRPDVRFWVYTRTENAARILRDTENLSLYFSADDANLELALTLQSEGIRLAYLADTFQEGQAVLKQATGKPGAKCPENTKQIPLISVKGSACAVCLLCPRGRTDIVFSATKK